MVQALPLRSICYAVRSASGGAARTPRAEQSRAAAALLAELGAASGVAGASSKSHSRAVSAAALAGDGRIGIDVEYCDQRRPVARLGRHLLGPDASDLNADAFYRLWTFYEAYFKAFGAFPEQTLRLAVAEIERGGPYVIAAGVNVLHAAPLPDFALTLVWTADAAPVQIDL